MWTNGQKSLCDDVWFFFVLVVCWGFCVWAATGDVMEDVGSDEELDRNAKRYMKFPVHHCTSQQVCNVLYLMFNRTRGLCSCPAKTRCPDRVTVLDGHTLELATKASRGPLTMLKTCEPITTIKECKRPKDWTLLALQNVRSGKSHYLITCRCPKWASLEGPVFHENPAYANLPGVRIFGMMCWTGGNKFRDQRKGIPNLPWKKLQHLFQTAYWS